MHCVCVCVCESVCVCVCVCVCVSVNCTDRHRQCTGAIVGISFPGQFLNTYGIYNYYFVDIVGQYKCTDVIGPFYSYNI